MQTPAAAATPDAGAAVRAICSGKVLYVTSPTTAVWDSLVRVRHSCGTWSFVAYYGHVLPSVSVGKDLVPGELLGRVRNWPGAPGNTHLHLGVATTEVTSGWGYVTGGASATAAAAATEIANQGWFDFRTLLQ